MSESVEIERGLRDRIGPRHLLETTALSLEEIAERTGFAHAGHLSCRFKEATGSAPGRYRRVTQFRPMISGPFSPSAAASPICPSIQALALP